MINAMVLRRFAPRTKEAYVDAVRLLAEHYHRSPALLSDQQMQEYLLHLLQGRAGCRARR